MTSVVDEDVEFLPMMSFDEDEEGLKAEVPDVLPILPLRNTVLFPGVVLPITVGRDKTIKAVADTFRGKKLIGVLAQRDADNEDPELEHLYPVGTVARIVKQLRMPDGSTTIIIQGKGRFTAGEVHPSQQGTELLVEPAPEVLDVLELEVATLGEAVEGEEWVRHREGELLVGGADLVVGHGENPTERRRGRPAPEAPERPRGARTTASGARAPRRSPRGRPPRRRSASRARPMRRTLDQRSGASC